MVNDGEFGLITVRWFANARAHAQGQENVPDLEYCYNIANPIEDELMRAGFHRHFWLKEHNAGERQFRNPWLGLDQGCVNHDCDFCYVSSHGRSDQFDASNPATYFITILFDAQLDLSWFGYSANWELGAPFLKWLAIYSCDILNITNFSNQGFGRYHKLFYGLHLLLSTYQEVYFGPDQANLGRTFVENLLDGNSVASAWIDAVNAYHQYATNPRTGEVYAGSPAAVISAERQSTWNNGLPDWPNTALFFDKYHYRGGQTADISHNDIFWFGLLTVFGSVGSI